MNYEYRMIIYDVDGNKLHFTAEEPTAYDAEMSAEEWATQGGVDVDWVEIIDTDDPNALWDTGKW